MSNIVVGTSTVPVLSKTPLIYNFCPLVSFILIVPTLNNQDDDAVGTMWKISITYQSTGNTNCAQVWYVAKQNGKFAWLGNSNSSSAGSPPSSSSQGIVTWTTSNGIRWQNNTGGDVDSVRCSALKIHGGTEDF